MIPRWTIEDRGDRETGVGLYFRSYTSAAKYTEELLAWRPPVWRGPEAGDPTPVVGAGENPLDYAFRKIGIPEAAQRSMAVESIPGSEYSFSSFRGSTLLKPSLGFTATGETSPDPGSFTGWKAAIYTISFHVAEDAKLPKTPSIGVLVNGRAVSWPDARPFVDANGRTMVPLRAVADALGLEVNWDGAARTASFSRSGRTIYFTIGGSAAYTTEGTVPMDTAAVIVDSRTYAPIRYLAEYFGHTVDWDGTTGTVIIK